MKFQNPPPLWKGKQETHGFSIDIEIDGPPTPKSRTICFF